MHHIRLNSDDIQILRFIEYESNGLNYAEFKDSLISLIDNKLVEIKELDYGKISDTVTITDKGKLWLRRCGI